MSESISVQVVEEYPIDHLTDRELQQLRRLMGLPDSWRQPTVRIHRDSPDFVALNDFLVRSGFNAALRR